MDPSYVEYNPLATVDDGSCLTIAVLGCMNASATNYDALANVDDGSCLIIGCTDSTMFNYDPPPANVPCLDDNNTPNGIVGPNCCTPFINGCMTANIVNTVAATADIHGNCAPPDNTQSAPANTPGSCYNEAGGPYFGYDVLNYDPIANTPDVCVPLASGCMDSNASNYDASVLMDDGSCQYNGCTDATAFNYNAFAINDDGSCCFVEGCTDSTSSNYDPLACFDDGSCIPCVYGCMDMLNANYDPLATCHDCDNYCAGTCGCMDPNAYNYDSAATAWGYDSCVYFGCLDPTAENTLEINGNPISCLDMTVGYNATPANYNAGITMPCGPFPLNSIWTIMPGISGTIGDGDPLSPGFPAQIMFDTCVYVIPGCTDVTAYNYNASATTDDGSCYPFITGCTDPTALNYVAPIGDPQVDINTTDNSQCCYVAGCNDPGANNFNGAACIDDGSCTYDVLGCMDTTIGYWPTGAGDPAHQGFNQMGSVIGPWDAVNLCPTPTFITDPLNGVLFWAVGSGCVDPPGSNSAFGFAANNYNPDANVDDGSCTYTQGCTDASSFNYNPVAYYPISTPASEGCTDSNATNYSAAATTDNGSCCYPPIYGCMYENYDGDGDGTYDYENYNHGSGSMGNPYNVQGWSQFRVTPTGNVNYDVNTHDQQMCILKDGCDEAVVGSTNCPTTQYTVHDNAVNTALYGERNGAGCTNDVDGTSYIVDYWNKVNQGNGQGNYTWNNTAIVPFTLEEFHGSIITNPGESHPFNLHENWSEFATLTQGGVTYPVETIFTQPEGDINIEGFWPNWDPAVSNSCCYVSGCLHPLALNFDAAGYKRNPDSPMDPIYVGVGEQRMVSGQMRIMQKADTVTQDFSGSIPYDVVGPVTSTGGISYTEGGQACQTSSDPSGQINWGGDGATSWHGGPGERFQRYFKNGTNEDGTYSGDYGPKKRCSGNGAGAWGEMAMMAGDTMTWGALAITEGCMQWRIDDPAWGVCVFPNEAHLEGSFPMYATENPCSGCSFNNTWYFQEALIPTTRPQPVNMTHPTTASPYASNFWNSAVMFGGCTKLEACNVPALLPNGSINPAYASGLYTTYNASYMWDDGSCCLPATHSNGNYINPHDCSACDGVGGVTKVKVKNP